LQYAHRYQKAKVKQDRIDSHFHGNDIMGCRTDRCRGTMHRAQGKQKTIKQEGHNSLCPYKIIKQWVIMQGLDSSSLQ